jgi:hypothetical protein
MNALMIFWCLITMFLAYMAGRGIKVDHGIYRFGAFICFVALGLQALQAMFSLNAAYSPADLWGTTLALVAIPFTWFRMRVWMIENGG